MSESGHATAPGGPRRLIIGGTESNPPRPMSFLDLLNIPALSDPQLSPDGNLVAYMQDAPDWRENKRIGHIWRVPVSGGAPGPTDAWHSRRIEPALVARRQDAGISCTPRGPGRCTDSFVGWRRRESAVRFRPM